MSSSILNSTFVRLKYAGGDQEQRMIKDKERTLRKALLYSYQACVAELKDGRRFKCLINPDKESGNYDNKIVSIPFDGLCLNDPMYKFQDIGMRPGDVFRWVETNTYWLVYLEYLEEDAYFRSQIRRCNQIADIDGKDYYVYIRGPVETSIPWNQKGGVEWNDMNHSLELYITKDENTINFFHRFKKIKIKEEVTGIDRMWQVVACNPYFGDGIIKASLDEFFENTIEEAVEAENKVITDDKEQENEAKGSYISGPLSIAPFDEVQYTVVDILGDGEWYLRQDGKERNVGKTDRTITIVTQETSGTFTLIYRTPYEEASLDVTIKAF